MVDWNAPINVSALCSKSKAEHASFELLYLVSPTKHVNRIGSDHPRPNCSSFGSGSQLLYSLDRDKDRDGDRDSVVSRYSITRRGSRELS